MIGGYREFSGKATVNNGAATATLVAAPGAGKVNRLVSGTINVTTAAVGGGGVVSIKDGTTVIMSFDANSVGTKNFAFADDNGYPMTVNTAINVVSESAVTTQATANVAVVGYIAG